jgi:hypothetical protein
MKINGACHCGAITFEADVDPERVGVCHCTDCQTLGGTAFRWNVPTREGAFTLLSGVPKLYVKTAESGAQRPHAFCPDCGTPIYSTSTGPEPKVYALRVGAIAQRAQLLPKRQIWARSAQPWVGTLPSVPKTEKQ